MSRSPRLSRAQLIALLVVPAVIAAALWAGMRELEPALAIVLGPLAGGFVRDGQSCCTRWSLSIAPFAIALVALGLGTQYLLAPTSTWRRILRWLAWLSGLLGWFGSALVSYLHALE